MSKSMECPVCSKSVALSGFPYSQIESHHRSIGINFAGDTAEMTCEGSYRKDYEGCNG